VAIVTAIIVATMAVISAAAATVTAAAVIAATIVAIVAIVAVFATAVTVAIAPAVTVTASTTTATTPSFYLCHQVGGHEALQGEIMRGGFGGEMRCGRMDGRYGFCIPILTQYKLTFFCTLHRKTNLNDSACHIHAQ
jgi:hypothetical protein